jgi:hypothetical protein
MTYLGLDPGSSSGALSAINNGRLISVNMPETDKDLLDLLKSLVFSDDGKCFGILESVSAFPGQGVTSCFHFGENFGKLQMALLAAEVPFERIRPVQWQKSLGCLTGGDKAITLRKAQELFPSDKITKRRADSVLLAVYAQRKHTGTL